MKEMREESSVGVWRESIPGGGDWKCKDSAMGKCLVCSQDSREATVAGAEQAGMEVGKVTIEATRKQIT